MRSVTFHNFGLCLGTALALAAPATGLAAPASGSDEALEARLRAQEERIRQLEEEVRQLLARSSQEETRHDGSQTGASAPSPDRFAMASPEEEDKEAGDSQARGDRPTARLRGRLQVDASAGSGEGMTSGTQIRRLFMGVEGEIAAGLRYVAEADFAGNDVNLQDALIGYSFSPATELVFGYFKPPNLNAELTSDVHTVFLERSAYSSAFAPGRRIGAALHHKSGNWGVRAGLFTEQEDKALDSGRSETWLASGRIHADLLPGDDILHLAVSTYYSEPSDGTSVRISQKPEVNRAPTVLDTGPFVSDRRLFGGAELGFGSGPFTFLAEGGVLDHDGPVASPLFWGFSAEASWRLTGEERPYDVGSGTFGRITPARPLGKGGSGAFETGLRLTHVDLDDDGLFGGRLTTFGLVLNWIPVTRVRVSGNLIHAEVRRWLEPDRDHLMVAVRGAVDW